MATGEYEYGSLIKEEVESVGDENDTNSDEKCGALEIGILKDEFEPEFIKLEDIDMVHNLKSEECLEEVKKELPCEVCGGSLCAIDTFSPDSVESSCKCQCQNESNARQDADLPWDFKPLSFGSDSGNFLFDTQEETVVEQKMLPETTENNEIFSSGYYSNSTEGSIIHEKNEMCSKNFNGRSDIENRSTKKTLFYCEVCTKSFTQSYHFKRHEKIHTGERPFQCKLCPKSFIEGGELKIHEKIHTGEKSFHCDICLKSFIRRSHLKQHQKLHTGEKPFQCKICPQSFFQRGDFKRHEKIHTGEKSFQCEICSKSFTLKRYLKLHEKIHTGEKSFQCEICSKSFAQKRYLKIHEKIHTEEKTISVKAALNHSFKEVI
ncbi:uncharacterized protein [Leptinotarsa decemlineata]|uniref:uncharacterized protein n=1 Tax=Leptinotarsa decemlineata TaxID=7539 RepID=UPI003D3072A4